MSGNDSIFLLFAIFSEKKIRFLIFIFDMKKNYLQNKLIKLDAY